MRLVAVGACALAAVPVAPPAQTDAEERLRQKQQELERLKETARDLAGELERTRSRQASARQAVFDLEEDIAALREKRRANQDELGAVRDRLTELEDRRDRLRRRVEHQQQRLAAYLRAAHRAGDHGFLRQLFGHSDPSAVGRSLTYLGYLHRARRDLVAQLRADRKRLGQVMAELRDQRDEAERLEKRLASQKAELDRRLAERQGLLEELSERADRQNQRLAEIRSDQSALKEVIERLQALGRQGVQVDVDDQSVTELKGELALPVAGAEILARYGAPRQRQSLQWRGLLLGAEAGSKVRAVFRGRVAYAERLRGYGLLTIVDHGDGLLSLYAHNRALYKEVGEWVKTGEALGAVGTSGGRRRPATYFEIRRDGQPVDPLRWCRSPGDSRQG
ncbi:murein hydrolase activator EnvC family protein [Thiohalorhabdus sp.]|uniref:murein hydrolase activator EnvC family protein n=1 Tax=Thiohalorhabdus sp. TaxID=3094134 RepID=UPI002FC287DF